MSQFAISEEDRYTAHRVIYKGSFFSMVDDFKRNQKKLCIFVMAMLVGLITVRDMNYVDSDTYILLFTGFIFITFIFPVFLFFMAFLVNTQEKSYAEREKEYFKLLAEDKVHYEMLEKAKEIKRKENSLFN